MELRFEGNAAVQAESFIGYSTPAPTPAPPPEKVINDNVKAETAAQVAQQKQESSVISVQDTERAVKQANTIMELFNRDLKFETHEKTGIVQISIVDRKDGKIIKQLPPDSVLDMVAKIKDMLGGLMDVKA